jgi:phosphoglycolate phosphatase-like HAD superfamily hydrolase
MTNSIINLVNSKKYIIFDFDGVILDSVDIKTEAFATLYSEFGPEIVSKVVAHHKKNGGISRFEKFKYYHKKFLNYYLSEIEIEILNRLFSNLVVEKIITACEIPGVFNFINDQFDSGKTCIINSATPQDEVIKIAQKRGISEKFAAIFGSPATKFENLEKVKKQFNCSYTDMIFFGDALSDWQAASKVGVDFIGIGKENNIFTKGGYDCPCILNFENI